MPGDLSDPAELFPFHNDSRYEHTMNPTETAGLYLMDPIIQDIASEVLGHKLGKEDMLKVHEYLISMGLMCRNPGDQAFMDSVREFLARKAAIRRVARKWLTSTNC
jgi:hypothetical protein